MSEEVPAVPAPAAPAEPTTPTTPAPEAAPASVPEQPAQAPVTAPAESASYFTKDQLTEMETFFKNNGGFEKVFGATKKAISSPQPQPEAPQAPSVQQMVQQTIQNPQAPQNASQSFREGSISMEEMAAMQYFGGLANDPKYANIADEIRSGAVLKGLKDFNINPLEGGRINDADVRKYLDLYAATKPAKPTTTEPTNNAAMADDLSNIKEITSMDEANRIQLDDIRRRNAGQPGNPLAEKAKEFVKAYYQNQSKGRR